MDSKTLRKVQLTQLEIAKEVKRICEKYHIRYFLTAGTLLGAIRHQGFIPWDDDLDIAMLKADYDRFIEFANVELKPSYELQTWNNDSEYPFEYAKVRKKGTIYVEGKSNSEKEQGIFIDIIVYINMTDDLQLQKLEHDKMLEIHRMLLVKCHYKPWYDGGRISVKKRIGYLWYKIKAIFYSKGELKRKFELIQSSYPDTTNSLFGMTTRKEFTPLKREWFLESISVIFEDDVFSIPKGYENYLRTYYGDYMQLPPEDKRGNQHQIIKISFGE